MRVTLDWLQKRWFLISASIIVIVWVSTQLVSATLSASEVSHGVSTNRNDLTTVRKDLDNHKNKIGHEKVIDKIARIETEVKNIKVRQSDNRRYLEDKLNSIHSDVKRVRRR